MSIVVEMHYDCRPVGGVQLPQPIDLSSRDDSIAGQTDLIDTRRRFQPLAPRTCHRRRKQLLLTLSKTDDIHALVYRWKRRAMPKNIAIFNSSRAQMTIIVQYLMHLLRPAPKWRAWKISPRRWSVCLSVRLSVLYGVLTQKRKVVKSALAEIFMIGLV